MLCRSHLLHRPVSCWRDSDTFTRVHLRRGKCAAVYYNALTFWCVLKILLCVRPHYASAPTLLWPALQHTGCLLHLRDSVGIEKSQCDLKSCGCSPAQPIELCIVCSCVPFRRGLSEGGFELERESNVFSTHILYQSRRMFACAQPVDRRALPMHAVCILYTCNSNYADADYGCTWRERK